LHELRTNFHGVATGNGERDTASAAAKPRNVAPLTGRDTLPRAPGVQYGPPWKNAQCGCDAAYPGGGGDNDRADTEPGAAWRLDDARGQGTDLRGRAACRMAQAALAGFVAGGRVLRRVFARARAAKAGR